VVEKDAFFGVRNRLHVVGGGGDDDDDEDDDDAV
jgi:hypothetical protein